MSFVAPIEIQTNLHELDAVRRVFQLNGGMVSEPDTEFTYQFDNFFHPFVGELIGQLNRNSLPGMLDPDFLQGLSDPNFFDGFYKALTSDVVKITSKPEEIDLDVGGPYANYNWELLFHVPLTIAVHLSKNQRFAEARRWFHYIFDPTANDITVPVPQRFWKFLAFRKSGLKPIDEQLAILSKPEDQCTSDELKLKLTVLKGYEAIKNDPFQPHKVARTRPLAYQFHVVMRYLDNLIAWGDSLFMAGTKETINEATMLYVLAANLLGQRPQRIQSKSGVRPKTFAELRKQGLDPMGNALVELEGKFPFNLGVPKANASDPDAAGPMFGIGRTLYFCVPNNDQLLGYWDTVADRLFKIRHCMSIEGVVRQLPLFDPPLDPGMLVKAAAAGIDIGSVVSGLNQPISPVRSLFLIDKSLKLCGEVRNLGAALLSAIEKGDGEKLAQMRQNHEVTIQTMQQDVRFLQWASAQEAVKSLLVSRNTSLEKLHYYQRLLGLQVDANAPDALTLDFDTLALNEENFAVAYDTLVKQYDKDVARQAFPQLNLTTEGRARLRLTTNEDDDFVHLTTARDLSLYASGFHTLSSVLTPIPDLKGKAAYWGIGFEVDMKTGTALATVARTAGDVLNMVAALEREKAGMAAKTGAYERRVDDWLFQYNLAAHELMQVGRQILSALIAEQIAHHDYLTVKQQVSHAQEVKDFLQAKYSNEQLYAWMQGEISRLYYEYYRFAFDTARKAEQAMKRELMRPEVEATDFIKFNYWDGGRKGLLSGEALYLDVERMEMAYHENNRHEFELTKHVSLRQLDPVALLALKATGSCQVSIPEWVFDLDTPGNYMRRIKSVAISIPSVVGPYTNVSCKLSLLRSSLRKSAAGDKYLRNGSDDDRFVDYMGAVQSIMTSNGQNDSGMFETNLRDGMLLPFEGAGSTSTWMLDLPKDYRIFNYAKIADVIFHIRHTARPGVEPSRVKEALDELFQGVGKAGLALLFSLRDDFGGEWAAFVNGNGNFSVSIRRDFFPYFTTGRTISVTSLNLYDGKDSSRHQSVGDQALWDSITAKLAEQQMFTFSAGTDDADPAQILTRNADVYLVVGYTLQ
jgi:hypothetical protein